MRAPELWDRRGTTSALLAPLGRAWALGGLLRERLTVPRRATVPVVCVGNATLGGAGKTPVSIAVAELMIGLGERPHLISRGYRGRASGAPRRVDPSADSSDDVGDEPLLLAAAAPTWVSADRPAAAAVAAEAGATVVVLDDGFQNPTLVKSFSMLVVDAEYGFGNGRVFPAGPLREPPARALARADVMILVGDGAPPPSPLPVVRARLAPCPETARALSGSRVVAFAGIARPEKLFRTLRDIGADIVLAEPFPDHHRFTSAEIDRLLDAARVADALPVTTVKDWVRLPTAARAVVRALPVSLIWDDPDPIAAMFAAMLARERGRAA